MQNPTVEYSNGKSKPLNKFVVSSSSIFEDMFENAKNCTGHTPTYRESYLCDRSAFPLQSRVPNLKSLAQVVLELLTLR